MTSRNESAETPIPQLHIYISPYIHLFSHLTVVGHVCPAHECVRRPYSFKKCNFRMSDRLFLGVVPKDLLWFRSDKTMYSCSLHTVWVYVVWWGLKANSTINLMKWEQMNEDVGCYQTCGLFFLLTSFDMMDTLYRLRSLILHGYHTDIIIICITSTDIKDIDMIKIIWGTP